jgi:hypothetical protein
MELTHRDGYRYRYIYTYVHLSAVGHVPLPRNYLTYQFYVRTGKILVIWTSLATVINWMLHVDPFTTGIELFALFSGFLKLEVFSRENA